MFYAVCLDRLSTSSSAEASNIVFLQHCYPGYHRRVGRDVSYHDSTAISLGPLVLTSASKGKALGSFHNFCTLVDDKELDQFYVNCGCSLADKMMKMSSASGQLASVVTLLVSLLIVKTLT